MICLLCDNKRTRNELSTKKSSAQEDAIEQTDLQSANKPTNTISEKTSSDVIDESGIEQSFNISERIAAGITSTEDKYDHNLYQEFNDRNLNSFKSFTYSSSSYSSSVMNNQIVSVEITNAETNYELKTGKEYTSYNIKVFFFGLIILKR